MKQKTYDVIVLGLGAMGSATAYQLARKGMSVLGIDQFAPPHIFGSTHGDTRITRLAIGEGEQYTPIVMRSHQIWKQLEKESGESLLVNCGGLIMADNHGTKGEITNGFLSTTLTAAKKYKIKHKVLSAAEIRAEFPQFKVNNHTMGYFEPEAGYLRPEKCVEVQLKLAQKHKATIKTTEKVLSYKSDGQLVTVVTDQNTYQAEQVVLTVGPWIKEFVPRSIRSLFTIYRQVLYWFNMNDEGQPFLDKKCPVYIWEFGDGLNNDIYGFPAIDGQLGGVKVASEQYQVSTSPDTVRRTVSEQEIKYMYANSIANRLQGLSPTCVRAVSCLYTVTPDHQFIIDRHPEHANVILVSPCSGHGFKHSAALGESVAEWVQDGRSKLDLSSFGLARFAE